MGDNLEAAPFRIICPECPVGNAPSPDGRPVKLEVCVRHLEGPDIQPLEPPPCGDFMGPRMREHMEAEWELMNAAQERLIAEREQRIAVRIAEREKQRLDKQLAGADRAVEQEES